MKLLSNSFDDGQRIPEDYAFGVTAPVHHVKLGKNINPHLAWSEVPEGTRSFVLLCHDPDVPSKGDDVNQEDRTVPATLHRVDFFHWVLIDLPAEMREIKAGEFSDGIFPRGKAVPNTLFGARQGINNYTEWFAGDKDMCGDYYGYDGPCPPWNDEIEHRYVFTLYALDCHQLELASPIDGPSVRALLNPHTLAHASIQGTYSLNPLARQASNPVK